MIDTKIFQEYLRSYKKEFSSKRWPDEKYKWEAVKCFQDNWDIEAADFPAMLGKALSRTGNLLASQSTLPRKMIIELAGLVTDEVKNMFRSLYNENIDIVKRIGDFKDAAKKLVHTHKNVAKNHYQDEHAISIYLWLRYPEKYYIYMWSIAKDADERLNAGYKFKKGDYDNNINKIFLFYNEILDNIKKDNEIRSIISQNLSNECYRDSELHTLVGDFAHYIAKNKKNTTSDNVRYWWLNGNFLSRHFSDLNVGESIECPIFNDIGQPRQIRENFSDVRVEDVVIGFDCEPVNKIAALFKVSTLGEKKITFTKCECFATDIDATLLDDERFNHLRYFMNRDTTLYKLSSDEYELIMDLVGENQKEPNEENIVPYSKNDFLEEVYLSENQYDHLVAVLKRKKNIILQGPPGVGKTFAAKRLAYSLMGNRDNSRVSLIQFHQNYSYEDFIMGYRPVGDSFELRKGIFYRFCQQAASNPEQDHYFIIDEINRGNISKIFGELLLLIENDYRGEQVELAYNQELFSVPENVYLIGMMNTADRSIAMIDYALRRRFSFFDMRPGFDSEGFRKYQQKLSSNTFNGIIEKVVSLNSSIESDQSLGKGFCIGHSYFCKLEKDMSSQMLDDIIHFDIIPLLEEYWFDNEDNISHWKNELLSSL